MDHFSRLKWGTTFSLQFFFRIQHKFGTSFFIWHTHTRMERYFATTNNKIHWRREQSSRLSIKKLHSKMLNMNMNITGSTYLGVASGLHEWLETGVKETGCTGCTGYYCIPCREPSLEFIDDYEDKDSCRVYGQNSWRVLSSSSYFLLGFRGRYFLLIFMSESTLERTIRYCLADLCFRPGGPLSRRPLSFSVTANIMKRRGRGRASEEEEERNSSQVMKASLQTCYRI